MPDDILTPTYVLTTRAVRWGIDTLGARNIHPTFLMYLYVRAQFRAGRIDQVSASAPELRALMELPGHPDKPFFYPFMDEGDRSSGEPLASFWRTKSAAGPGSWALSSIRSGAGLMLKDAAGTGYALGQNHADEALEKMLYGTRTSALAMGTFFLRNDGFVLSGEPRATDIIAGFRAKFDYPADTDDEFDRLFTTEVPDDGPVWFEQLSQPGDYAADEG